MGESLSLLILKKELKISGSLGSTMQSLKAKEKMLSWLTQKTRIQMMNSSIRKNHLRQKLEKIKRPQRKQRRKQQSKLSHPEQTRKPNQEERSKTLHQNQAVPVPVPAAQGILPVLLTQGNLRKRRVRRNRMEKMRAQRLGCHLLTWQMESSIKNYSEDLCRYKGFSEEQEKIKAEKTKLLWRRLKQSWHQP